MGQQMRPAPRRVFIVGCPRSGTTFLQNSLAAHPAVLSLPETTYFDRILNNAGRWIAGDDSAPAPRPFGFARGRTHRCAPGALRELAEQLGVARSAFGIGVFAATLNILSRCWTRVRRRTGAARGLRNHRSTSRLSIPSSGTCPTHYSYTCCATGRM